LGASGFVALIGWLDDHRSVPVSVRLLGHALAAAWALFWLDVPPLVVAGPEYVAYALAALYIVWVLNLYNFMDGIDGIASIEAITVCLGGILLYVMAAPDSRDWMVPLLLIFCLAGFLYWNYPPARLFLGDSGSGFLGIVLALFSIRAGWVDPQLFWGWTVLLGVFIVDATVTLVRRVMSGRKFYVAHRSHAYQYASRKFGAHEPVALAVGAINLFWLLPLAMLVANDVLSVGIGLAIAYFPLFLLALWLKAGAEELKDT
jgi:Fuc2NAc and GlcNAc transferase